MAPSSFPSRARAAFVLAFAGVSAAAGYAGLQWDSPEIAAKVRANEPEAHASFGFVNAGAEPVTITGIKPGCGCTVPALAKSTFAPGERGAFTIAYHAGNREGLHRVDIEVTTDDDASYRLAFIADIEALVTFDTRFVYWKGAETRTPKHIRVAFAPDHGASLVGVSSSDPRFAVAFRAVGDSGLEYEIEVTPPAEVLNYTAITLHALIGEEKVARDFTVVARTM